MIALAEIVGASVELLPAGPGRLRGLCPFHSERTPSFFVFEDRQKWRCFGCGEHGDKIDFIRRSRGCGYREALSILCIDSPKATAATMREIRRKRAEKTASEWREREVAWTLGKAIRVCHAALRRITPETLVDHAPILQHLCILEYQHQILMDGDADARAAVVAQYDGISLFRRTLLFRKEFDCRQAMRVMETGTPNNERSRGTGGYSKRTAIQAA